MDNIVIIDYGAGNVRSVQFALERLGYEAVCTSDISTINKADKVIFPGVGEASSAMKVLRELGLDVIIPKLNQPVLGICLGMQLMCEYSEEGDANCLGIFPLNVLQFSDQLKVPHMGWNQVETLKGELFDQVENKENVYFVHSYYVPTSEYTIASSGYGIEYAAAIQKDNFYACQFHPEKSGGTGEQILANFLKLKS